jgi:hypothetical protein
MSREAREKRPLVWSQTFQWKVTYHPSFRKGSGTCNRVVGQPV